MKILAVDTSTQQLNVCISDNENVRAEISCNMGHTHSKFIMPVIDSVLALGEWNLSMIDGFAVTQGPGSFTGIRIGISTVKGLASAGNKPVAGISSLDALAYQTVKYPHLVCVALDARKKEVYFSQYRWIENRPCKMITDSVLPIGSVIENINETCLFIGSGAQLYQREIIRRLGDQAVFPPLQEHTIRPSTVARLGFLKFSRDECYNATEIAPCYLRAPDAVKKKNMAVK